MPEAPAGAVEQDTWPTAMKEAFRLHVRSLSSANAVHQALSDAITSGQIAARQPLREEELADVFRVSRTPVREALMRLEAEGLATRNRRGLCVSEISKQQTVEVYQVREVLDGLAARLAAETHSVIDLAELDRINELIRRSADDDDYQAMARLNVAFHTSLAEASHNFLLQEFVEAIHRFVLRFRSTTFEEPGRASEAIIEHERILTAIRDGDPSAAEAMAKDHMTNALQVRIRMLTARRDERQG